MGDHVKKGRKRSTEQPSADDNAPDVRRQRRGNSSVSGCSNDNSNANNEHASEPVDSVVLKHIALHRGHGIAFRDLAPLLAPGFIPDVIEAALQQLMLENMVYAWPDYQSVRGKYFRLSATCPTPRDPDVVCEDCGESALLGLRNCQECAAECYNCGLMFNSEDVEPCSTHVEGSVACPCKVSENVVLNLFLNL